MAIELHERLCSSIRALDEVVEGRSRFGGVRAFRRGRREFAHFHGDDLIDVRLPRPDQRRLGDDPRAIRRPSASAWIELRFASDSDVDWVLEQVRKAYAAAG